MSKTNGPADSVSGEGLPPFMNSSFLLCHHMVAGVKQFSGAFWGGCLFVFVFVFRQNPRDVHPRLAVKSLSSGLMLQGH
jgi:hypothetical protein